MCTGRSEGVRSPSGKVLARRRPLYSPPSPRSEVAEGNGVRLLGMGHRDGWRYLWRYLGWVGKNVLVQRGQRLQGSRRERGCGLRGRMMAYPLRFGARRGGDGAWVGGEGGLGWVRGFFLPWEPPK